MPVGKLRVTVRIYEREDTHTWGFQLEHPDGRQGGAGGDGALLFST